MQQSYVPAVRFILISSNIRVTNGAGHGMGSARQKMCMHSRIPDWTDGDIPEQQLNLIRGIQANVWTERIQNTHRLDFMIFPRICALAEAAWTPDHKKNYADFRNRLEKMYPLWDQKEIYYFDTRETERHSEPTGPQQQKRNLPMNFRD